MQHAHGQDPNGLGKSGLSQRHVVQYFARQTVHPNVQRKLTAALAWCERINGLSDAQRAGPPWHYVLLGESALYEWQSKGARLAELLQFSRVRPLGSTTLQVRLL